MKRSSILLGFLALSVAISIGIGAGRSPNGTIALSGDIPAGIRSCVERDANEIPFSIANRKEGKTEFFLIGYRARDVARLGNDIRATSLVSLDRDGCTLLLPKALGYEVSRTLFVPEAIARELTLAELRESVRLAGGMEKFIREIESPLENTTVYLFPEQVWAYERLKLPLPKSYKTVLDRRRENNE